jgi:hypothetical protein
MQFEDPRTMSGDDNCSHARRRAESLRFASISLQRA